MLPRPTGCHLRRLAHILVLACTMLPLTALEPLRLWPGRAPGETAELPPEGDTTKPSDRLVAGRPVVRIGNVSDPTITVYPAREDRRNGAAVLVCPGGRSEERRVGKGGG